MSTLVYTNSLQNGTTADADEVMANFNDAANIINGSIDGDNIDSSSTLSIATLTTSGLATLNTASVGGVTIGTGTTDKTRTIAFTASGAISATTNGANKAKIEGTNFEYYQLEFDKDTDESVYWIFPCPDQYDGSTVKFDVISKCATVTSGTVVWVIKTGAVADSTTWDSALGTTVTFAAKTVDGTALDIFTATKSADPAWVAGQITILRLFRDTSEDNAAEDVDVVAINAYWEVT